VGILKELDLTACVQEGSNGWTNQKTDNEKCRQQKRGGIFL
jgi:hypothetical protein